MNNPQRPSDTIIHCYDHGDPIAVDRGRGTEYYRYEVRLAIAHDHRGYGDSTAAALEDLRRKSGYASSILNGKQVTFQTSIRFGVNRRKPGSRSARDIEHKNSHAFIMVAPDDADFHNMVRHTARCKFNGWSLTGYVILKPTEESL